MTVLDAEIEADVKQLFLEKPCKDMETFKSYSISDWLAARPPRLLAHIRKLCRLDSGDDSNYLLARMIENMYNCRNSRLILPLAFRDNIVTYKISNSSVLSALAASYTPSGSHTTLTNWLNSAAEHPVAFPPGLVRVVFDNEQVVGKRYRVKSDKMKVPLSLITSHAYLSVDKADQLQFRHDLKPKYWMFQSINEEMTGTLLNSFSTFSHTFRETRNDLITSRLNAVQKHLFESDEECLVDEISELVNEQECIKSGKICKECGEMGGPTQRVCKHCKGSMEAPHQEKDRLLPRQFCDPYKHFQCMPNVNEIDVITGEPDMVKPNSIENIKMILQNLGKHANIENVADDAVDGERRQWLFLENDGGILDPILKLVFKLRACEECDQIFFGSGDLDTHMCDNPSYRHVLDWVIPQMGLLHLEINAGKSFMNLCWDVFMKSICSELGFQSENALKYAKKGSDHHKLWDILEITYIAFVDELMFQFLTFCAAQNIEASMENYWTFSSKIINPNFLFVQQMVFMFLHALMLLRRGTRCNNYEYIYSAKNKLSLLFFARNHPIYHNIITQERRIEILMPEEVRSMKFNTLSLSRTSRTGHYQSGDAIIEEVNKEAKRDLVGIPSTKEWKRSFRNLDNINAIRSAAFHDAGITDPKSQHYDANKDISKEVRKIRVLIRESKYLATPFQFCQHTDITQTTDLSERLVNFVEIAEKNRESFIPCILKGEEYKLNVVVTTKEEQEESEKVENMTMKDITAIVLAKLEAREDKELLMEIYKKEVRGKSKSKLVIFYHSLMETEIDTTE